MGGFSTLTLLSISVGLLEVFYIACIVLTEARWFYSIASVFAYYYSDTYYYSIWHSYSDVYCS